MATIRAVPVPYATPQAANDAAVAGDTILLAPGSHASLIVTKRVHIKGDTTNPAAVSIVSSDADEPAIAYALPSGTVGDVWLEGVTLSGTSTGLVFASGGGGSLVWPVGCTWRVNRVIVANATHYLGYFVSGGRVQARIEQLTSRGAYGGAILYLSSRSDHRIELLRADLTLAPAWPGGGTPANWALYSADWVTTPATDYGAGYGTWYAPQWQGAAYQIYGQTLLPVGVDRSLTQVRLYRETSAGRVEASPWAYATPHPVTGEWTFAYLPMDLRYHVLQIPPQGYKGWIDGPYIPETT